MTTTAAAAIPAWTASRLRNWLSVRHSLPSEAAAVLVMYGLYELARGLVVGDTAEAWRSSLLTTSPDFGPIASSGRYGH